MEPVYVRDAITIPSSECSYLEKTISKDVQKIIKILEDEYGANYSEATYRELFILTQDFAKRVTEILTAENIYPDNGNALLKNIDQSKYLGGL